MRDHINYHGGVGRIEIGVEYKNTLVAPWFQKHVFPKLNTSYAVQPQLIPGVFKCFFVLLPVVIEATQVKVYAAVT